MRCSKVEKQLAAYIDGLLEAREADGVRAHLEGCSDCRAAAEDIEFGTRALRALPTLRAPATFAPRIRSAVRLEAERVYAPVLFGPDARAFLSGAFFIVLALAATRYVVQPYSYVAPPAALAVAVPETAIPEQPSAPVEQAGPRAVRGPSAAASPSHRAVRRYPSTVAMARTTSAVTGPAPSTERVTPEQPAAGGTPTGGQPPATRGGGAPDAPTVSRMSMSVTLVGDSATRGGPGSLTEGTANGAAAAGRAVLGPEVAVPRTTLVAGGAVPVADTNGAETALATAGGPTDADAPFGFDDIFSEQSLPRFADVS